MLLFTENPPYRRSFPLQPQALAEGVGFEPTEACDLSGFQDRCNKPLYHPSFFEQGQISSLSTNDKSQNGATSPAPTPR